MNKREIDKKLRKISLMEVDENCEYCNKIMDEINYLIEEI